MDSNLFVYGYGFIDKNYFFWHASEELRNQLGLVAKKKLTDSIHRDDIYAFKDAVDKVFNRNQAFSEVTIRLLASDNTERQCRLRFRPTDEELCHMEIIDIENALETCIPNAEALSDFKFLFEREHRIFFEYSYETGLTDIYSYKDNEKLPVSKDDPVSRLSALISAEIASLSDGIEFDFIKVFSIDETDYFVRGAAITRNSQLYKMYGTIGSRREDSGPHSSNPSTHDAATGLYNKPYALSQARKAIESGSYQKVSLCMIDIDDFKTINDSFSHMFGDEVIKKLSIIIRDASYGRGFAGRFGGDEFFICLYDIENEDSLRSIIQSIYYHFKSSFPEKNHKFSLSTGISEYPRNGDDFDKLLKKADRALYKAKFKGKDRYIIYKEEIHGELPDSEDNVAMVQADSEVRTLQNAAMKATIPELVEIAVSGNKGVGRAGIALRPIMDAFYFQGISIYEGPDFKCRYRFGTYTNPVPCADYIKNPDVLFCFTPEGVFNGAIKNMNSHVSDSFQIYLSEHGLEFSMHVIIGTLDNIHALVTFDREVDRGNISNAERQDLVLIAQILANIYL